jgi:hypothetical protein
MRLRTVWLQCAVAGTCALTSTAYGQAIGASRGPRTVQPASPQERASEVAQKETLAESIIAREEMQSGREFDPGFRIQTKQALLALSLDALEAQRSRPGLGPKIAGDSQADLVFTPVTPCRIINTRLTGTPIAANTTRSFKVTGDTTPQGGANCGIPFGPATAAEINFVAVNATAPGDLRATPFGTPMPTASILNWASVPGLNIANGITVAICDPATTTTACTNDITLMADASAINIVADVQGYYRRLDGSVLTRAIGAERFVNAETGPVSANLLTGVVAPTAGGLLVTLSFSCESTHGTTDTRWTITPMVDGMEHNVIVVFFLHASVALAGDSASASFFHPVAAGTHTISYKALQFPGDGSLDCDIFVTSQFVPFNNTGGTP